MAETLVTPEPPIPSDAGGGGAPEAAPCTRKAGCIKGAGHAGRCAAHPTRARDRMRRLREAALDNGARDGAGKPRASAARPGRPRRGGKTGAMKPLLAMAWSGVGKVVEQYAPLGEAAVPVGRMIQFQAPYAAEKLHPALRMVPAYARADDATGGLFSEIGPLVIAPAVVGLMATGSDKMRAALEPLLFAQLELMAASIVAERKRIAAQLKAAEVVDDEVRDEVMKLAAALFGSMPEPVDPQPATEPEGAPGDVA